MANEWKRATWAFQPITLAHTYQNIIDAIDAALQAAGWAIASWSSLGPDTYYLRPDRFRVDFTAVNFGATGNQPIVFSSGVVTKSDMAGGGATIAGSTQATGWIALSAQPADGDTITLQDGTNIQTFEFDDNNSVSPGAIAVTIGSTVENTLENLAAAVPTSPLLITAVPHWNWWYTGDNYYQHGGIHIHYDSTGPVIRIGSFIENNTQTGMQQTVATSPAYCFTIAYDVTQENDFLFLFGEEGIYIEGGTAGLYNNIAHGFVSAFYPDPTLYGTRDRERTWAAQGLTYDLRGAIRCDSHTWRFVETVSDLRNHTGTISGVTPRGTQDTVTQNPSDFYGIYFGPREHLLTANVDDTGQTGAWYKAFYFTLGLIQSNFDDIYRVSALAAVQYLEYYTVRNSGGTETTGGPSGTRVLDMRNAMRPMIRFGCCSSYLLPWNNITDKRTKTVYRVAQVVDTGRNSNICIQWPDNTQVVTIPTTP